MKTEENTKKEEMKKEKTVGYTAVFENPEFGKIRIQTDENGEPLFCAKDVCNALGYKKSYDAVKQLVNRLDTANAVARFREVSVRMEPHQSDSSRCSSSTRADSMLWFSAPSFQRR